MQVMDTVPGRNSVTSPPSMGGEVAHPRPEAEKPQTADTAVHRSLSPDTRPGSIARSDDAPFIYQEINNLALQFGRLEKQVEITASTVEGHRATLHTVSVNTETLCNKHEQFKTNIDTLSANITNTLNGLIAGSEGRLTGRIDSVSTSLGTLSGDVTRSTNDIAALKTEQAKVVGAVNVLKPITSKGLWLLGVAIAAIFGAGGLFWSYSIQPNLVREVSAEVLKALEKEQLHKDTQAENSRLKALVEKLEKTGKK